MFLFIYLSEQKRTHLKLTQKRIKRYAINFIHFQIKREKNEKSELKTVTGGKEWIKTSAERNWNQQ